MEAISTRARHPAPGFAVSAGTSATNVPGCFGVGCPFRKECQLYANVERAECVAPSGMCGEGWPRFTLARAA